MASIQGQEIMDKLTSAYNNLLSKYNVKYANVTENLTQAEKPVQRLIDLFQPGGGYGAGQNALIERGAKQGYAAGLSNLVATGMSSGTNTAGLRARITSDANIAKLGVEDTRVGQLANALGLLSQLRTSKAGTLASISEPDYGSYAGALTSAYNTMLGNATQRRGQFLNYSLGRKQLQSQERLAAASRESEPIEKQHFNTPW